MAAGVAAMLGIETQDDLLKLVEETTSPMLFALAEDLPSAQTSSILALVINPQELLAQLGLDPSMIMQGRPDPETLKLILVGSTMIMQELDKRIPPRMTRGEAPLEDLVPDVVEDTTDADRKI